MRRRTQIAVAGTAAVVALGAGTGAVAASSGDDDASDTAITGAAKDRAEEAALAEVGEGSVTGTELDDEESRYEVEVTLDDGTQVDVQLDDSFQVVGQEDDGADDEGAGDDG